MSYLLPTTFGELRPGDVCVNGYPMNWVYLVVAAAHAHASLSGRIIAVELLVILEGSGAIEHWKLSGSGVTHRIVDDDWLLSKDV